MQYDTIGEFKADLKADISYSDQSPVPASSAISCIVEHWGRPKSFCVINS